jgi:hypothetical protein
MEAIVNRVANSGLITIDLQSIVDDSIFTQLDLRSILWQGLALREKDLKDFLQQWDPTQIPAGVIWIDLPEDIIVPQWTHLLIQSKISSPDFFVTKGPLLNAQREFLRHWIQGMKEENYKDQRVVIKGCTDDRVSSEIQMQLVAKLLPWVKSLMFGEPCSTVPLYKRP